MAPFPDDTLRWRGSKHAHHHENHHDSHDHDDEMLKKRGKKHHHTSMPRAKALVSAFLTFYVTVLVVVGYCHTWLPAPMDENAPSHAFSEARARIVLEYIMSFGYRPVGSVANEVLTPNYLVETIEAIKNDANMSNVDVDIQVQRPSGAFGLDFLAQFQNIYSNVTNIVVRVTPRHGNPAAMNHSLLLSSHYDAAIGGAAASDDGVSVAIMVELLRLFVAHPPSHASLIFNFNGAEETILQGAHGFITQHPWKDTIRAFINLEAAGAGGRELLFQTGSDALAMAYVQGAKYPHASIIAQEIFQSGVIPADTDYRVYRDFGYVAGMDFAYIANGYVYHTKLDDISRIQHGAIQRLGDNVLGVIDQLANQPGRLEQVAATPESSNTLFFDIAGYTMISMDKRTSFTLCGIVLIVAVVYLSTSPLTRVQRMEAFKLVASSLGSALLGTVSVAVVLSVFAPLSWYAQPYLAAAVFVPPALAGLVHSLAAHIEARGLKAPVTLWKLEEALFEAMLCMWLGGLVILLAVQAISSYMMALWIVCPLIGQMLCHALQRTQSLSSAAYIGISLASVAVPVVHSAFILAIALQFFIPLMGRSGTQVPPDLVIGLTFYMTLVVLLSYTSRFFCFLSVPTLRSVRNLLLIVALNALVLASLRNPYSTDCPKRLWIQHVERTVHLPNGSRQSDAGLWVNAIDFRRLAPIQPFLASTQWKSIKNPKSPWPVGFSTDAPNEIYGYMPYVLPVKHILPETYSWYLPCAAPVVNEPKPELTVISSKYLEADDKRRIHLKFAGPSHLHMFIDAKSTKLASWSIGNGVNEPVPESNGTYILQFASGTLPSSFHFWIEAYGQKPLDVVYVGHYLEAVTPELAELQDALPSWVDAPMAVSTWTTMQI